MGTELLISFFKDKSPKWYQFKEVWDTCGKAEIEPPEEVIEFFGADYPDDENTPGELALVGNAPTRFEGENEYGYIIDLKSLPNEIRFVKVYIS